MLDLLFPRFRKSPLEKVIDQFNDLQKELEKRVERLESTKAKLIAHANGALHELTIAGARPSQEGPKDEH